MLKTFIVGVLETNCYLYSDDQTGKTVLIDPGDEGEKIFRFIENKKLNLTSILLTHGHPDHFGAVPYLKRRPINGATTKRINVPVYIHQADYLFLTNVNSSLAPLLGGVQLKPDKFFAEGQEIPVGEKSLKVLFTPGHTPGGVCLAGEGVVFSGDTLFYQSVGRTDLPGGDTQKLLNSIKEKLFVLPDKTIVYPGHGEITSIGEEKKHNPFLTTIV